MAKEVKIGLVGYGTIGQGVVKLLRENQREIQAKLGAKLSIVGVVDTDWKRKREVEIPRSLKLNHYKPLLDDPDVKILVELVGDYPEVKDFLLKALSRGKWVVCANKALLAKYGDELFSCAKENNAELYFEASVGGGIPIIRVLKEGLCANRLEAIYGIVNGTCNYILSEMSLGRGGFKEVLKEAQRRGYAEKDPSSDIDGLDAVYKLAIITRLGFGLSISPRDIYREGIAKVTPLDLETAHNLGYELKLLAIAKREKNEVSARVHPTLIPRRSVLANVSGVFNAIYVVGNFVGPTLYYGKGAGMEPTASAVVSDVIELARNLLGARDPQRVSAQGYISENPLGLKIKPMDELESQYYMRLWLLDQPGVLAKVSGVLARYKISISSVLQQQGREGKAVPVVIITHLAKEQAMQKAVRVIDNLKVVSAPSQLIRIITNLEG